MSEPAKEEKFTPELRHSGGFAAVDGGDSAVGAILLHRSLPCAAGEQAKRRPRTSSPRQASDSPAARKCRRTTMAMAAAMSAAAPAADEYCAKSDTQERTIVVENDLLPRGILEPRRGGKELAAEEIQGRCQAAARAWTSCIRTQRSRPAAGPSPLVLDDAQLEPQPTTGSIKISSAAAALQRSRRPANFPGATATWKSPSDSTSITPTWCAWRRRRS